MKIAVCISGAVKYPKKSIESIKRIYPNEYLKVFIHTWNIPDNEVYSIDSFSGKSGLEGLDILSLYNAEKILIEDYNIKKLDFKRDYERIRFKKWVREDIGIISMYYSIFKSNQLKIEYEKINNIKFDIVIRMRFDSDFKNTNLILDPNVPGFNLNPTYLNCIQIPTGNDWRGINDQFALGSSFEMDCYSSLYKNLKDLSGYDYDPEFLLLSHLNKHYSGRNPIQRFNFSVGINGNI